MMTLKTKLIGGLTGLASLLFSCAPVAPVTNGSAESSPNIILLIGDGMGVSQLSTAYYYGEGEPAFSRFPVVGLSKTSSGKEKITDSAAGATALSTGKKTYNGAIGVGLQQESLPTIVELLDKSGYQTGLIATSSITHATPASFFAHVSSRSQAEDIATQMANSPIDFFAGGGEQFFSKRKDGSNLVPILEDAGFQIENTSLSSPIVKERFGYFGAPNGLKPMHEGRGDFLPEATLKALNFFEQKKAPFFLMIEGSQIDWGGHANDGNYIVQEVLDFDKTIAKVLDYAEKQGNTLVIVTADHETGGYTLSAQVVQEGDKSRDDYRELAHTFSTGGHSTALVPVLAYGPKAQLFSGIYENTEIFEKMMAIAR